MSASKRRLDAAAPCVETTSWRGRAAVALRNHDIEAVVVAGGGHIVSLKRVDGPHAHVNALWEPPWPTTDPALRRLNAKGDLESMLLSGIGGANMCCDVFGEQSKGEIAAGLAFHGEAGLSTWEVEEWDEATGALVLCTYLRRSQLQIRRTFTLNGPVVAIKEELTNLCSVERAMGRCQHVTIGEEFLVGSDCKAMCAFSCNADKGHTWPVDFDPTGALHSRCQPNTEFNMPLIPLRPFKAEELGSRAEKGDWTAFPPEGVAANSDLCTLRVDPKEAWGCFCARRLANGNVLTLGATWRRADFPWLMTWDENRARTSPPWNGRTLCRGMEISSYAFATSRRENVERGRLLGQPTFEWLDADETKVTRWYLTLQEGADLPSGPNAGWDLCKGYM